MQRCPWFPGSHWVENSTVAVEDSGGTSWVSVPSEASGALLTVKSLTKKSTWTLRQVTGPRLWYLSLIHISEPTRRTPISYAVFCLKKKKIQSFKHKTTN